MVIVLLAVVVLGSGSTLLTAQTPAQGSASTQPFVAGTLLKQQPNVTTYGGFRFAESVSYDAERDLYVAVNAGIAQDVIPNDGYILLVNPDGTAHTLNSPDGKLLTTEESTDAGNDGIVVLADGTKYVSSVRQGTIARIRPGSTAERIADGIPTAASMTYDSKRNRLVIPMNDWNAITIVDLAPK